MHMCTHATPVTACITRQQQADCKELLEVPAPLALFAKNEQKSAQTLMIMRCMGHTVKTSIQEWL